MIIVVMWAGALWMIIFVHLLVSQADDTGHDQWEQEDEEDQADDDGQRDLNQGCKAGWDHRGKGTT